MLSTVPKEILGGEATLREYVENHFLQYRESLKETARDELKEVFQAEMEALTTEKDDLAAKTRDAHNSKVERLISRIQDLKLQLEVKVSTF